MTAHLNGLSFVDHALEFFFSNTRNGSGYPGLMAVTVEPGRKTVQDLQVHIPQKILQDLLRCLSSIQKSGDGDVYKRQIIICVNGDQKDYQISGYLHNKIRQCLTYSTPRLK